MQVLADVPILTLVASAAVLVASTVVLTRTLSIPSWPQWARRSRRRRTHRRRREWLLITGRTPELPPGPLPASPSPLAVTPPRQEAPDRDVPERIARLAEAEATIDELLDTDPDYLARMMMLWIRDDGGGAHR